MIAITCSACEKNLSVRDESAGKKVRCPGCGQVTAVPMQTAAVGLAEMRTMPPAIDRSLATIPPPKKEIGEAPTNPPSPERTGGGDDDLGHDSSLSSFLAPPQADDELGRLGKYRILKILGHGGMGVVFLGEDPGLGRKVAIKAMLPHLAQSKTSHQRFLREAKTAATLEHDHIVPIFQVDEDRGAPYIVMPFLKGEPLDARLKNGELMTAAEISRIGREVAEGLAAAHGLSMVHRDIKPANIWLEAPRSRVKILDFGLARLVAEDAGLTQQGAIIGTPAYMAPEQGRGEAVDARCDLFSLGVVLYRMCTGQLPFQGTDTVSTLMAVALHEPAPPIALNAELPPKLSDLVMRLLAKKPEDRPATAKDVVQELAEIESKLPRSTDEADAPPITKASPSKISSTPRTLPRSMGTSRSETATLAAPRKKSFGRFGLIGGGLALLGLLVVLGVVILRIETPEGTLIVEMKDADVEARIKNGKLVLAGPDGKDRYIIAPSQQNKKIDAGAYTVRVEGADGLALNTREFTLKKGGEVTVRVTLDPKTSVTKEDSQKNDANRWHVWSKGAPPPATAPFDAAQAKAHQEAWAKHLGLPVEYPNSIGMKFVLIPPGEFTMGSTSEEIAAGLKDVPNEKHWQECVKSEGPRHKVILTQPMYLGIYEVSQAEYKKVMGVNPSYFAVTGEGKKSVAKMETDTHPVEMVSWNDAAEFCTKLSQLEKLKPVYFRTGEIVTPREGNGYRLPSEAEWEFACRAGTATKYWIGDRPEDLVQTGWFGGNSGGRTHAVGELKANPFGLYDMHGNVWEWVQDGWDAKFYGQFPKEPAINPNVQFSIGTLRVVRGGGWDMSVSSCRSSHHFAENPANPAYYGRGFRVALTVDAVKATVKN
jgi:serine/threonine protein kinase/formylglycine-generating enzyme required for sulfatase activity